MLWTLGCVDLGQKEAGGAKGSRGSFTLLALSIYLITILLIMLKSKHFFQCCATGCCLSCLFVMPNLAWVGCYYSKMTESSVDISISYVLLIMEHHDDSTSAIFTYSLLFVFHMPSHCCHCLIDYPVWCSQWDILNSLLLSGSKTSLEKYLRSYKVNDFLTLAPFKSSVVSYSCLLLVFPENFFLTTAQ